MPDVMEPDHLAVRRVEKGYAKPTEVERAIRHAAGVALGLDQHVLRTEAELLGFDNAEDPTVGAQGVVCRASVGGILFERVMPLESCGAHRALADDFPPRVREMLVDASSAGFPLGFFALTRHGVSP
jgi:hypothetical protein